jgi:ring-1,2-phenylacetyl-CoA epoxidase subunit PaaD
MTASSSPAARPGAGAPDSAADAIWALLDGVMDPEVPVLSVVELGIVRAVTVDERHQVTVSVTPTYSGCPAMNVIERDIASAVSRGGWPDVRIETVYTPVWTTDWIGDEARRKLVAYGIAAPPAVGQRENELVPLRRHAPSVPCPYCGSTATTERSEFGATACKAVMYCEHCHQPFELFKAI